MGSYFELSAESGGRAIMSELKAILWTGGDAPNKEAKLTVTKHAPTAFVAWFEPGYCGCPDCHPVRGFGKTEQEAIADYWREWEEKYDR
jgi:hypothetical protein